MGGCATVRIVEAHLLLILHLFHLIFLLHVGALFTITAVFGTQRVCVRSPAPQISRKIGPTILIETATIASVVVAEIRLRNITLKDKMKDKVLLKHGEIISNRNESAAHGYIHVK